MDLWVQKLPVLPSIPFALLDVHDELVTHFFPVIFTWQQIAVTPLHVSVLAEPDIQASTADWITSALNWFEGGL